MCFTTPFWDCCKFGSFDDRERYNERCFFDANVTRGDSSNFPIDSVPWLLPFKHPSTLIEELWKKSNAPFTTQDSGEVYTANSSIDSDLYYFPALPKVRSRCSYVADKKSNDNICTKRTSKHRALLPGIFTLFCQHGMLLFMEWNIIEHSYTLYEMLCM